jgi:hypothetical protein
MGVEKVTDIGRLRFGESMLEGGIRPMLRWISIFAGLQIMMGNTTAQAALLITSAWKIRRIRPACD